MFLLIFCILILFIPTAWALWDDRNGDKHPNKDLLGVGLLCIVTSSIVTAINPLTNWWFDLIRSLALSGAIYTSIFPYAVNYMLFNRGIINAKKWYDHLSKTAWPDRLPLWAGSPWYVRAFVYFVILFIGAQIYFCPGKIIDYFNACFCLCD
jgi:hypothetical protein